MLLENGTNRLAQHRVATNLQFLKKKHYLQNKIRQSIRKQGTPTLLSVGLEDQILFPCLGDTKNLCLEMTPNTGEGSKCSRTKLESKSISPNRTVKR